ncbi:hypothetical protein D9M70_499450 [compost metagenome]
MLNTELLVEVPYHWHAVLVERERDDLKIVAPELFLEAIQGRHLLATRCAPSGPKVQQNYLSSEIGQASRLPLAINEADILHRSGLGPDEHAGACTWVR